MTTIDKKFIKRKFEALQDYIDKLKEFRAINPQNYVADYRHHALAEHYLQLCIEIVLDVARHLVISLNLKTPEESHGLLPALEKAHILSADFVKRNLKMPGFRNRLVHEYEDIDHAKTFAYLQEHLQDFGEFMKQISGYVSKKDIMQV